MTDSQAKLLNQYWCHAHELITTKEILHYSFTLLTEGNVSLGVAQLVFVVDSYSAEGDGESGTVDRPVSGQRGGFLVMQVTVKKVEDGPDGLSEPPGLREVAHVVPQVPEAAVPKVALPKVPDDSELPSPKPLPLVLQSDCTVAQSKNPPPVPVAPNVPVVPVAAAPEVQLTLAEYLRINYFREDPALYTEFVKDCPWVLQYPELATMGPEVAAPVPEVTEAAVPEVPVVVQPPSVPVPEPAVPEVIEPAVPEVHDKVGALPNSKDIPECTPMHSEDTSAESADRVPGVPTAPEVTEPAVQEVPVVTVVSEALPKGHPDQLASQMDQAKSAQAKPGFEMTEMGLLSEQLAFMKYLKAHTEHAEVVPAAVVPEAPVVPDSDPVVTVVSEALPKVPVAPTSPLVPTAVVPEAPAPPDSDPVGAVVESAVKFADFEKIFLTVEAAEEMPLHKALRCMANGNPDTSWSWMKAQLGCLGAFP